VTYSDHDVYSWADFTLQNDVVRALWDGWQQLYREPYKGLKTDGQLETYLFSIRAEDAPIDAMVDAVQSLLQKAECSNMSKKLRYAGC
jgi:hypothetical protein